MIDVNAGMKLAKAVDRVQFSRSPEAQGMACACVGPPWCCALSYNRAVELHRAAHIVVKQLAGLLDARRAEGSLVSPEPASTLLVPPPPLKDYAPMAGDQWVVAVMRAPGVMLVCPSGWTRMDTMHDVEDPEVPGRRGDVTFFHRTLCHGDGGQPVVFHLASAVWAKGVLQAYRPGFGRGEGEPFDALGAAGEWTTELEPGR